MLPPPAGRTLLLFELLHSGLVVLDFTNGTFSFKLLTLGFPFGVASFTLSLKSSITLLTLAVVDGVDDGPDDPEHGQNQIEGQKQDAKNSSPFNVTIVVENKTFKRSGGNKIG